MALAGALAISSNLIGGFTNRPSDRWSPACSASRTNQASCCYDLRRLRLKGLIERLQHTNTYVLTADGQRFAIFYTKVGNRVLRPLMAADQIPAPLAVRQSLRTLDRAVTDYLTNADRPA